MAEEELVLFALNASSAQGERIAQHLEQPLSPHEERGFEDGEHKARPLINVRGCDVYVIHSLYADAAESVNDKLCRLLFFIGALKDAAAARITAVVPYLCYARKDRKTKARDPVSTRYVAGLFEAVGADQVLTMDVHNLAAYQNAFRHCRTEHLEARPLFAAHLAPLLHHDPVTVLAPDIGGVKGARAFSETLGRALRRELPVAFMEKSRSEGVVSGSGLFGEIEGRTVVILDDLIATGTTLLRAARACQERGAKRILVAATHGLFLTGAEAVVADPAIEAVLVSDTVSPFRLPADLVSRKLTVIDTGQMFADAIAAMHGGGSITALNQG